MLFNSVDYFLFLPVVLVVWRLLPHSLRWTWLLAASLYFYLSWNIAYGSLILVSILAGYFAGLAIADGSQLVRRFALGGCLVFCLGLLFFFKYWNFATSSLRWFAAQAGIPLDVPEFHVLLPVGISFYTFQILSYAIDVRRGTYPPERHLGYFALYVTYFPQLVAGPIERADHLVKQLKHPAPTSLVDFQEGAWKLLWGLFKKVVVADRLAIYVQAVYDAPEHHTGFACLLATYAFAFQIYCDFSGYSDIAAGSARFFGVRLMENFELPYFSTNIGEFWRRWHVSLSSWLRDYIYIPLGGNRAGRARQSLNLMITMLLGGLWHGANWTFVLWGGLQGVLLSLTAVLAQPVSRCFDSLHLPTWFRQIAGITLTFHLVCLGWILFRAASFDDARCILTNIISWKSGATLIDLPTMLHGAMGVAILLAGELVMLRHGDGKSWLNRRSTPVRWGVTYALLAVIALCGVQGGSQFIYFQF